MTIIYLNNLLTSWGIDLVPHPREASCMRTSKRRLAHLLKLRWRAGVKVTLLKLT